ncbi:chorismate-binding protein, partial [Candidatus Bathyarchaeota archaeon]|nr:chorismate-binding protein [Candidatus Bathyarchaeota archaeon]
LPKSAVDVRGRYSVVALDVRHALQFQHRAGDDGLVVEIPGEGLTEAVPFRGHYEGFWQFASDFLSRRRISPPEGHESPFLGGFMGYVSYEMGLYDLGIPLSGSRSASRPDVSWVWVTRSLVVDHVKGVVHIQQLRPAESSDSNWKESLHLERREGENWIESIVDQLRTSSLWKCPPHTNGTNASTNGHVPGAIPADSLQVNLPPRDEYMAKVKQCQDYIAKGESYELCLTNKVHITLPKRPSTRNYNGATTNALGTNGHSSQDTTPWHLYKSLRKRQPAPFGSYLRLGPTTLLSSSPERFLSCSREGVCFMHPMKGTAKKSESVRTLADAEALLRVPKEEAENLMIVDLVRHDLHSVCGPGNVDVPRLMQIEEYASVFQMITVVKGTLPQTEGGEPGYTALDALSASLPPGSMTGAPKKRSCEILQGIEGHRERGVYSGVTGYVDVSGKADWSVNIRCLFRYDDESAPGSEGETWHVGAGGAVTTLSTPEGECEEMFAKLEGSLGLFGVRG